MMRYLLDLLFIRSLLLVSKGACSSPLVCGGRVEKLGFGNKQVRKRPVFHR